MNDLFSAFNFALTSSFNSLVMGIAQFLPRLLGAILTFSLGVILGGWAKAIILKLTKTVNFSKYVTSSAIQKFFDKAQIKSSLEVLIAQVVRATIILLFFISSVNLLGLTTITQVLTGILAYIPSVISATIILIIGVLLAGIVEKLIKGSLGSVDIKTGRGVAKLASYTVVIFAALAAFSQLGIAQSLVNTIFIGFVAMLALGLGLSLGLGSKDLVQTILENWYKGIKKDLG